MGYKIQKDGFEGQDIEVVMSFWSGIKLMVNGEKAQKGPKRNQMLLKRNDGKEVIATWKPKILGLDVPQIEIDGEVIEVVRPLTWQELIFVGSPIAILFLGGAVGAGIAIVGFFINAKLFRSELSNAMKYISSIAVTVGLIIGYLIFSVILLFVINNV
jgi:hypothetical protein